MRVIERYEAFTDHRGEIRDLLRDIQLDSVTLIRTAKGAVRGNHYHHETQQYTYMLEGVTRWVTEEENGERQECIAKPGDLILSDANERHAMVAEEDSVFLVFTHGPRSGASYESDTFRLETPLLP